LDKSVLHEDSGLRGRFRLSDEKLTVLWGNDAPEVFVEVRGKYVHSELLRDVPVVDRLYAVNLNETLLLAKRITLEVPGGDFDVELRLNRRDVEKFEQVFLRSDFASPDLPEDAQAVVDIGANTGLVSVFFGLRYPRSTILAIEYGEEEFSLLTSNTSGLAARMIRRRGLIEPQADELPADIPAPGSADGDASSVAPTSPAVFTLTSALDDARFTGVDILKVDLDPGPLDSFFRHAESWLPRVSMIVVEAGEQILEESRSHVRATLAPAFDELPPVGQNLFFRRRHAGTGRRVGRRSGVHEGGRRGTAAPAVDLARRRGFSPVCTRRASGIPRRGRADACAGCREHFFLERGLGRGPVEAVLGPARCGVCAPRGGPALRRPSAPIRFFV